MSAARKVSRSVGPHRRLPSIKGNRVGAAAWLTMLAAVERTALNIRFGTFDRSYCKLYRNG